MKDIYSVFEKSGLKNLKSLEPEKIRTYLVEKVAFAENSQQDFLENMDDMHWFVRLDMSSKCNMRLSEAKDTLKLFDKVGKTQFLTDMFKELPNLNQFHVLHEIVNFDELNSL